MPNEINNQLPSSEMGSEAGPLKKTLLYGYGNIDRQDDGVAWHVLRTVAEDLGRDLPQQLDEIFFNLTPHVDATFDLQLIPEAAELIAGYERVCFIDAHTGRVEDLVHWEELTAQYEPSPFTHHLTAATCLSLAKTVYKKSPEAVLVSIRGFEFGFSQSLSENTWPLVIEAAKKIITWIKQA